MNKHLSASQAKWIRRFVFNRLDGRAPRGMYEDSFIRYRELGGTHSKRDYTNYLSRNIGSRNVVDGLPDVDAEKALLSIGLSSDKLKVIDEITREMLMRGMEIEDTSRISESEEKFFQACASLLWTKNGNDIECANDDFQESLLELLDSIIEHTEKFTYRQKKLIFHELFDFLIENRQYERWGIWVKSIAREYRKYFCAHAQKGYSDWFPGCIVRDDGNVEANDEIIDALSQEELDELAFLVSCKDLEVNNIRHAVFFHTVQIERLTSKIAKLKEERGVDSSEIANAEYDLKEHKSSKRKGKSLLCVIFAEIKRYIEPVWDKVHESNNPNKWYFLFQCARLFYDYSRYHYYSSIKEDREKAIRVYEKIVSIAHDAGRIEDLDLVIRWRFYYLSATACRYQAEYTSDSYCAINFIKMALEDSSSAVVQVKNTAKSEHLPSLTRKSLEYRFTRHLGRMKTFAIRWWLKHGCPKFLFSNPARIDGDEDKSELEYAECCYHDSVCQPLGLDEGREDSVVILDGKRKLEWEFHLRVQIEMLVHEFDIIACDRNADTVKETPNPLDLFNPLIDAENHLCLIVCIYCYLFPARSGELQEHRPFTHISREVEARAKKWLMTCGKKTEDPQFDYMHLHGLKQSESPSLTSQLETICAIMFDFSKRKVSPTQLYMILDEGLSKSEEHCQFRDEIWYPFKDALSKDKETVENIYKCEMDEFGKVTKSNCKEYPLYRHRFEMVYGPGSNASEVDKIFSYLKLDWNPARVEIA